MDAANLYINYFVDPLEVLCQVAGSLAQDAAAATTMLPATPDRSQVASAGDS